MVVRIWCAPLAILCATLAILCTTIEEQGV